MKIINIKDKLTSLDVDVDSIVMGDFDYIGKFTAERQRSQSDENYKKYGAFFRANYERGILMYHLVKRFNIESVLEIGFGRGYSTFCVAKAFFDAGIDGKIVTVDPILEDRVIKQYGQVFPKEWFHYIQPLRGTSNSVIPQLNQKFDMVYIDGDHSYEGTKLDWDMTKSMWNKCMLFDDYHMPTKHDPGINCRELIDSINEEEFDANEKELIIMDRRMFFDDRQFTDDKIDYGQVLLTKKVLNDLW